METIQEINSAIMNGNFNNEQLLSVIDAVKYARSRLTNQIKYSLTLGDNVNFTSTKTGRNMTGVVTKIAIKYVTVKTINGMWRVPANMLSLVENEYA
jgi:hypothetical protein